MSQKQHELNTQHYREMLILDLDKSEFPTDKAHAIADNLFALDLTIYSKNYSVDSLIYSSFARSKLDQNIILHPEQLEIVAMIEDNPATIISAPTSFGKTYCAFEYIAKNKPCNIVLVVPTLALVDEYLKKIIRKYADFFDEYNVYTQLDSEKAYDFNKRNIFILTHDKVMLENTEKIITSIDFLLIDEVYKLETDLSNDRVLVLNMAYYHLSKISKKYLLLAPFIESIEDIDKLEKKPCFYNTNYSPVVNNVETINILSDKERFHTTNQKLKNIGNSEKTLIYFPTVTKIYGYVNEVLTKENQIEDIPIFVREFINWAKDEIHDEWCVVKALERGYVIHNGQMPLGTRMFQLDLYEKYDMYNRLMCTSTLLEGVNTTAKNIIITQPARTIKKSIPENFSAFDFYNLVGRTGRLNQHFIGNAYYIKAPKDPIYKKIDAIKSIKFEITDESIDIDIQKGDIQNHPQFNDFIILLGITYENYLENIGNHMRFETVLSIHKRYTKNKKKLVEELRAFLENKTHGRQTLINLLYFIGEGTDHKIETVLINQLINKKRLKLKTIINKYLKYSKQTNTNVDYIISTAIRMKMSYIEHSFYNKVCLIKYFLECDKISANCLDILDDKVLSAIEQIYFTNSKQRKMLLDIGIYEFDIEKIIKAIGSDFEDAFALKKRLIQYKLRLKDISYMSKYIIDSL